MSGGTDALRVIVMGYLVRGPLGGMAWSDVQYLDCLAASGHDVLYVEDSDDYASCYDPRTNETTADPAYGLDFAQRSLEAIGLGDRWAFYDAHTGAWLGPAGERAVRTIGDADVVLNLAGVNPLREWAAGVPLRVYVDQDPAFTQLRNITDEGRRELTAAHNAFATFAENFGNEGCTVPDDGFAWFPTRQPVRAERFTPSEPLPNAPFTTVMQWESYPGLSHEGIELGMKSKSFAEIERLPQMEEQTFELAVGAPSEVRARIEAAGWLTCDPRDPTETIDSYESYLQSSRAEIGIAKHGYVSTRSGWFSERSLAYMVCGRPVVARDTGFSDWLPVGTGLHAFIDVDGAAEAVRAVSADPALHGRAAAAIAAEHFDGRRVVRDLLENAQRSARASL